MNSKKSNNITQEAINKITEIKEQNRKMKSNKKENSLNEDERSNRVKNKSLNKSNY
jgi:hypothetical protein